MITVKNFTESTKPSCYGLRHVVVDGNSLFNVINSKRIFYGGIILICDGFVNLLTRDEWESLKLMVENMKCPG